MASLIKKQILKHLSKFTKNLSADKINVSTLKGEGELSNLELDCIALQNLMELPTWLQINHATCNRVSVKIAWTKLKTVPICIFLDAVEVEMVTCEKPREPNGPSPIQASATSGDTSYGFAVKVLEGMTVNINSISVNFSSAAFNATFQLSQLMLISTNPNWERSDLRYSRITDKTLGQVLTFKKLSWQTMRIVADAATTNDKANMTPLRLITNQSEIRMTFRRKTSDCSSLASRLHVHFDDLLWVLTDSQVQSALLCVKSLNDTIDRSNQQMRDLGLATTQDPQLPSKPLAAVDTDDRSSSQHFANHTVVETSIHIDFDRVDLHICEEGSPVHKSVNSKTLEGGAIQIALHNLKVDHYPHHKAASDRTHFRDYGDTMVERNGWADGIIKQFRKDFVELKKAADSAGNLQPSVINRKPSKLVESCFSVRLTDIDVHEVTTSNSKKQTTGRLFNSTRKELLLPDEMPLLHFISTEYYYPDGRDYPAPHDNVFMQLNAPQFHAYWDSLVWLNRLSLTTVQAVQKMLQDLGIISDWDDEDITHASAATKEEEHVDIRIQVLMPKLFIPASASTQSVQPLGLEVQISRAAITNCRDGADCSRTHLKYILSNADKQYFARNPESFPSEKGIDMVHLQDMLYRHAKGGDLPLKLTMQTGNAALTANALKSSAAKDVWAVDLEQVWIDFIMPASQKKTPSHVQKEEEKESPAGGFLGLEKSNDDPAVTHLPFLDSFPAMLWICKSTSTMDGSVKLASPNLIPDSSKIGSPSLNLDSLSPSRQEKQPFNEDIFRRRSQTDVEDSSILSGCSKHTKDSFRSSLPDVRSKSSPSVDEPLNENITDSPRSKRNKRLLDYYRTSQEGEKEHSEPAVNSPDKDQLSISSSSSSLRNKTVSTHIIIHTDKSVRLQLDHHQYIFLLRLIDTIEDVENQLELDSKRILSSSPSSALSTPSHSGNVAESYTSNNVPKKLSRPFNTSSIRLSAPTADLFLILRPPPPDAIPENLVSPSEKKPEAAKNLPASYAAEENLSQKSEKTGSPKSDLTYDKPGTNSVEVDDTKLQTGHTQLSKAAAAIQDTPPLSECGSDTLSILGSDNISIFGDSSISAGGCYPHTEAVSLSAGVSNQNSEVGSISGGGSYPHSEEMSFSSHSASPAVPQFTSYPHESTERSFILPKDCRNSPVQFAEEPPFTAADPLGAKSSLSKQKSGSLSALSNDTGGVTSDASKSQARDKLQFRNYSSDNLALGAERTIFNGVTPAKSSSSGYESGSYESLTPAPAKSLSHPSLSPRSSHSHSSSDASDQFVMIQVDEQGLGLEESGAVKIVRKSQIRSPASSITSETSSVASSQGLITPIESAKSEQEHNSLSSCGLADSQITVTNMRTSSSSLESETSEVAKNEETERVEKTKQDDEDLKVEFSSLLHLHVSEGVELSVDSNDANDSVVRIVATIADVVELGLIETGKVESIFMEYSPKKIAASRCLQRISSHGFIKGGATCPPHFRLRVDTGPLAERFSPAAVKEGHIQICADGVSLALKSSTLENLAAFVEDEAIPTIVPMKIDARDVKLTIKDDMPPAYEATPQAPPVTLHVHSATVLRSDDGTFHVTTTSSGQSLSQPLKNTSSLPHNQRSSDENLDAQISKQCNGTISECSAEGDYSEIKPNVIDGVPKIPSCDQQLTPLKPLNDVGSQTPLLPEASETAITNTNEALSASNEQQQNSETIEELKEKLRAVEAERDSLISALRCMQDELIASERERSNWRSQCS